MGNDFQKKQQQQPHPYSQNPDLILEAQLSLVLYRLRKPLVHKPQCALFTVALQEK